MVMVLTSKYSLRDSLPLELGNRLVFGVGNRKLQVSSESGVFEAAEWGLGCDGVVAVDPDAAGLNALGEFKGFVYVRSYDA